MRGEEVAVMDASDAGTPHVKQTTEPSAADRRAPDDQDGNDGDANGAPSDDPFGLADMLKQEQHENAQKCVSLRWGLLSCSRAGAYYRLWQPVSLSARVVARQCALSLRATWPICM